ncbi:MAG TPA: DUF898 family protein [Polyangiales bacterium]|nr:DUF898 family protein [Polyangiales bacterium]
MLDAAPQPTPPEQHVFSFHGTGGAFFALVLKNMVLTLLTLGIYMPWAKTERRKFLWQNIEIDGHRLRYHGTGKELFVGYLKVAAAYALFLGLPIALRKLVGETAAMTAQLVLLVLIVAVIPYAIWGSRRYLLSRTSWRGVYFRLEGGPSEFAKTFFLGLLLTIVTLGIYAPVYANRLHKLLMNSTALGTQKFEYRGQDLFVFKLALKNILFSLLTLGVYSFWYRARLASYQAQETSFSGARGQLNLTGVDLLALTFLQMLGLTFTLGIAFPWIMTYSMRFVLERMRFVGNIDFSHIYQAETSGNAAADGLADALDLGAAL